MQITQCLADIQQWKEDRKKLQKEYEEQEKLKQAKRHEESLQLQQKLEEDEQRSRVEQERLESMQQKIIKNAIQRIKKVTKNSGMTKEKLKSDAKREVIDETLKSK